MYCTTAVLQRPSHQSDICYDWIVDLSDLATEGDSDNGYSMSKGVVVDPNIKGFLYVNVPTVYKIRHISYRSGFWAATQHQTTM